MKRYLICSLFVLTGLIAKAQDGIKLKDLAVPNSPAFILTDITPTLVQTPNTPKKFILGLAQSFGNSSSGFPDNYSAEFAPYWFFNADNRSIYSALGLKKIDKSKSDYKQDVFSGLKFTSLSVAFINKDLIPDDIDKAHKVFALGIRTTIIKVQQPGSDQNLSNSIIRWHTKAQNDLTYLDAAVRDTSVKNLKRLLDSIKRVKQADSVSLPKQINDYLQQKPVFSWDVAGAYASYGINDAAWQSGRTGIWTTMSTYLPLATPSGGVSKNYVNMNISARSLWDNFTKNDAGLIAKSNAIDFGGKAGFEFDGFSIGVESLYRYTNGKKGNENRTVGVFSYKIAESLYITGAFGKNFESQSKAIALFGINWGLGSEKIDMSK
jgi:hypothetical protein